MKKLAYVGIVVLAVLCLSVSAFAGMINPGDKTSCNNANSITLEAKGSHPTDRTNANAVIWKSSNFSTVPISLGPSEEYGLAGPRDVGMSDKFSPGRNKVTLTKQDNFSRGDSIGDISGEVRITNTGTVPIEVVCGN